MPYKTKTSVSSDTEKRFYVWLLLIILILAAGLWFYSARKPSAKPEAEGKTAGDLVLNVLPLQRQDVEVSSRYIGYVTPIKSVNVVPNVSGYLDKIWVQGGQDVKAGDNLLLIEQSEYKARLDAAKASVAQAQADLNNAAIYYKRMQKAGAKAVSKTELDNAKAKYLSAQGALAQAKAEQELAQVNLNYTLLTAPVDGVVGNVDLTKGNYVSPSSQPLLKIIQYNPIRVVFSITDKEYLAELARSPRELFAGEKIRLSLGGGLGYPYDGQFRFTGNEIDRSTNSIAVYADFPNPAKALVVNAYVDVILEKTFKNAYLIRQNYVSMTPEGYFAYIIKDGRLIKTSLNIAAEQNENYVVTNNFGSGEYLVVDKVGQIAPGRKIRIKVLEPDTPAEGKG